MNLEHRVSELEKQSWRVNAAINDKLDKLDRELKSLYMAVHAPQKEKDNPCEHDYHQFWGYKLGDLKCIKCGNIKTYTLPHFDSMTWETATKQERERLKEKLKQILCEREEWEGGFTTSTNIRHRHILEVLFDEVNNGTTKGECNGN